MDTLEILTALAFYAGMLRSKKADQSINSFYCSGIAAGRNMVSAEYIIKTEFQ